MKCHSLFTAALLLLSGLALAQKPAAPPSADSTPQTEAQSNATTILQESKPATGETRNPLQSTRAKVIQKKIPILGDLPLLGPLFRTNDPNQRADVLVISDTNGLPEREKRVSLDVTAVPVREVLKQLFDQVKATFEVQKDVPEDAKVTLKLTNVRFATALDAVTETAEIGWQRQVVVKEKAVQWVYKVGKRLPTAPTVYRWNTNQHWNANSLSRPNGNLFRQSGKPNELNVLPSTSTLPKIGSMSPDGLYNFTLQEDRHTFTCPHCRQQVTVLGKREAPKCEKCGQAFQAGWKVCPFDGAKRPADPSAWQFCPHCGKRVTP